MIEPPPSIIKLIQDVRADAVWKNWLNQLYGFIDTLSSQGPGRFITPASITVNTGGTPVGTVTNVQTLNDGNVYQVPEVTGTPGFDIDFNFTGVSRINGFVSMTRYDGSASHDVEQTLYNYDTTADDSFLVIHDTGASYQYRTVLIPDDTDYIDGSGNAVASLIHTNSGNASHDVYIDYIALLGD